MLGLSFTSFGRGRPERGIAPVSGVTAKMTFTGNLSGGGTHGETRTVTSLTVTNTAGVARWVEVEEIASGTKFSATIPAGQTVVVPVQAVDQFWNATMPWGGRWDGLNIRWKEPA